MATDAERTAFEGEAERLGLTVEQLADLVIQGAMDALTDELADWQRQHAEREVAA